MNVLNGIQWRPDTQVSSPFTAGPRHVRRMLWFWLTKVVGWGDFDKSGSTYDNTELTGTDGVTDSTGKLFSTATGGLQSTWNNGKYFLVVHPTDASSALTGGFTDSDRNGFYLIRGVRNTNQLVIDNAQGVDLAGMPASETGLNFSIVNFASTSLLPSSGDFFVVEGDINVSSEKFHVRVREDHTASYGRHHWQLSPYADWDAGADDWDIDNRVSTEISVLHDALNVDHDVTIYGAATKNFFWLWVNYADNSGSFLDSNFYSCGEFSAFHAADQRPVIMSVGQNTSNLDTLSIIRRQYGTNSNGTVPLTLGARWMSDHRDTDSYVYESPAATISRYSGRLIHLPIIITSEVPGYESVRGQLPYKITAPPPYTDIQPKAVGTNLDFLRINHLVFPWNGSRVRSRYIGV